MVCGDLGEFLVEAFVGYVEHIVRDILFMILACVACIWEWIWFCG
jgi:hypothetical protein